MTDTAHYKKVLTERRAYLMNKSEEIEDKFEQSGDEPFDGDSGEVRNLDVLDDLDDMAQSEIRAIDAALDRIKNGTYGICVISGDPIEADRLKTLPHTPFCKDHAPICGASRPATSDIGARSGRPPLASVTVS